MSETTLASITAAAADQDLHSRLMAAAALIGVEEQPNQWVASNHLRLAAATVTDGGDTIASIYEYAVATYSPSPRPGENPAAVTDEHLLAAVRAVAGITSE